MLLDLQELVLTEGGPYWHRLPRSADLNLAVVPGRDDCCAERRTAAARGVVSADVGGQPDQCGWTGQRANLGAVADAAREWFKNQPDTAPALAQRLGEFRRGCTTLNFASHKPLAEAERLWLLKNCREWAKEIDRALIDLEGGASVEVVRAEMDRTVEELVGDLRKKAEKLKG